MSESAVLEEIRNDLQFLKEKMTVLEISISEIDADLHRAFNPQYAKKLSVIEKKDKRTHFRDAKEFDKHFGIRA